MQGRPQAWLCLDVLDDLLMAGTELLTPDAPGPVVKACRRLVRHAMAALQAVIGVPELAGEGGRDAAAGDSVPAELHWADNSSRPLLRLLAQAVHVAWVTGDKRETERLIRWGLALNPHDNHGWRHLLAPLYLGRSAFEEALTLLARNADDMPPAAHHQALALFGLGRREEAEAVLREAHAKHPALLAALLPDTLDAPPDDDSPFTRPGSAEHAFQFRTDTRPAWVTSGALAWARDLALPEPKAKPEPKPKPKPAAPKTAATKTGIKAGPGGGLDVMLAVAADGFDPRQQAHLRKAFGGNYPRLHGLLTAVAWSPELLMPSQWLQTAMALSTEPTAGLTQAKAMKAMDANLQALMGLLNSQSVALLHTPTNQSTPVQAVLAQAESDEAAHAWAAGFVQGAELAGGAWRRAGRPVSSGKGAFGELYALAARAPGAPDAWRARQSNDQPLLLGIDDEVKQPVDALAMALTDLWRVVAPLRQAQLG